MNDHHFPQLLTVQLTLLSNISRHVLIFTVLLCRSLILFYCLSFSVIPILNHLIGELFLVLKWNIHFMIDYQIQLLMWWTQHSAYLSSQNVIIWRRWIILYWYLGDNKVCESKLLLTYTCHINLQNGIWLKAAVDYRLIIA